jgi:excisionase family DNA binding protein
MPRKSPAETALFVRIPTPAVEKLGRAAAVLGVHKKDLVAGLVTRYIDPDSQRGLDELSTLSQPRRLTIDSPGFAGARSNAKRGGGSIELPDDRPRVGTYSFQPHDPPEVMNAREAAELLQVDEQLVLELAEGGGLPGRKLGTAWRFTRTALLAWLGEPEQR